MKQQRTETTGRIQRRGLYWTASITLLAAFLLLAATGRETRIEPTAHAEPRLRVETVPARLQTSYQVERAFVGRVEAARSSDLGFELAGRVERVLIEEGDAVVAGQRLAVLDRARLLARRGELVAALERARAQLELARSTHLRVAEAAGLDAVSDQEHDEARLGLRAREAGVRQLEAQIRSLDVEIEKSILAAPYAAVVAAQLVDEGEVLPVGQPVVRLLEAQRLEARIGAPPDQVAALAPGDPLEVTVRGRKLAAEVKAILPDREAQTRTVTVLLALAPAAGAAGDLRDGDLAEIVLSRTVAQQGFWLPASALAEGMRGLWAAFVAEPAAEQAEGYRIARRDVEVLHTETDRVFVRGALREAEKVITGGVHRLVPGQRVAVENAGDLS